MRPPAGASARTRSGGGARSARETALKPRYLQGKASVACGNSTAVLLYRCFPAEKPLERLEVLLPPLAGEGITVYVTMMCFASIHIVLLIIKERPNTIFTSLKGHNQNIKSFERSFLTSSIISKAVRLSPLSFKATASCKARASI